MATLRVLKTTDDLAEDLRSIAARAKSDLAGVAQRGVKFGETTEKRLAKERSGPHGKFYWKRISSEMLTPLSGEWGAHGGGTPVGAGFRNGPPNMDSANSADITVERVAGDVSALADRYFW